jgi:hypothetical protein
LILSRDNRHGVFPTAFKSDGSAFCLRRTQGLYTVSVEPAQMLRLKGSAYTLVDSSNALESVE